MKDNNCKYQVNDLINLDSIQFKNQILPVFLWTAILTTPNLPFPNYLHNRKSIIFSWGFFLCEEWVDTVSFNWVAYYYFYFYFYWIEKIAFFYDSMFVFFFRSSKLIFLSLFELNTGILSFLINIYYSFFNYFLLEFNAIPWLNNIYSILFNVYLWFYIGLFFVFCCTFICLLYTTIELYNAFYFDGDDGSFELPGFFMHPGL